MRPNVTISLLFICAVFASAVSAADFVPDPATVQHDGPAYRYPQAGWIVLHVEGEPYERGRQQGKLLWHEIQDYVKCFATQQSSSAPSEAWPLMRTIADSLFIRHFDPELLEEMKGIADGAAAAGAKFDSRPLDLTDIVAINVWPEMMTLGEALKAEPTGLEGKDFDKLFANAKISPPTPRCSSFAATGPATRDGKAIIGHVTMFDVYPCDFFNVWIDVKPARGHRLVFQAAPGSVQSGMDWYENDAGVVMSETTIRQTRFNPDGLSEGSRSRLSMQYGDSIESVVKLLGDNGNGLYTNEWLLADMKTNEIALYELGTRTSRLMRSSKNEWFGGTTGFYWGNNNTKDLDVRLETIAATNDRPFDATFYPEIRDSKWVSLYQQYKGKIDGDFARVAFGRPPLDSRGSCDAKYVTSEMALKLQSFAHWGDPYGQLWEVPPDEQQKFPDAKPIVPNDWAVITTDAPPAADAKAPVPVDVKENTADADQSSDTDHPEPPPAWHGTILAAADGDVWLASSFARFHDYVAREKQLLKAHQDEKDSAGMTDKDKPSSPVTINDLTQDERDELAVNLFHARTAAMGDGMPEQSVPLRSIQSSLTDDHWFRSASGRGVMLLSELRRRIGADKFDAAMDSFGRAHAGKSVDSQAFVDAMVGVGGSGLKDFFSHWLDNTDALPTLELSNVASTEGKDSKYVVSGHIIARGPCPPANVDVTVETASDETTTVVPFAGGIADFHLNSDDKPVRVVVNKYGRTPCVNGWNWGGNAFYRDLDHVLIIYGTAVDEVGNNIAANKLQQAIVDQWEHLRLPVLADTAVSDADLRGHHLLLVGRPECSELIARLTDRLPVKFGRRSFTVRGDLYANSESAVIVIGANPMDAKFSVACIAGMSAEATLRAAETFPQDTPGPVKIMGAHQKAKDVVPAAEGLSYEMK